MKNIFTKLLSLVLALMMVFAFASCEDTGATAPTGEETKPEATPEASTPEASTPEATPEVTPETTPTTGGEITPAEERFYGYDLSNYSVFEVPLSKATVYGEEKGAIKFLDIWGEWQVVEEGDNKGAAFATLEGGSAIGLIYEYDFSKAKKVTLSADIMIPNNKGGNQNIGFVFHTWDDTTDSAFYWETAFNNYFYVFTAGGGSPGCSLGAWAGGGATWNDGSTTSGWTGFNATNAGVVGHELQGVEFQYGEYFNLKGVWNAETLTLENYYGGQLGQTATFTDLPFDNVESAENGGPKCGIRSNSGECYFKNITLIIE